MKKKLIGGFFELELPSESSQKNMATQLKLPDNPAQHFANARSALAMLLITIQPKKIWIPAYICHSVVNALQHAKTPIFYYSVSDTLEPNVFQLNRDCVSGDVILGINYFGQPPSIAFRDFVNTRNDLIFIEDSAQAIDTGYNTWGDWQLFSPRKILGVADGGYIVPKNQTQKYEYAFFSTSHTDINTWNPAYLRFEDTEETNNQYWHSVNQQRENTQVINNTRMSHLSCELLKKIDASLLIQKRKKNFYILHNHLSNIAFLPSQTIDFCPFGFPIRLDAKQRTIVCNSLIQSGIFPAVHWKTLPSPNALFKKEHALSNELLTLPCDQRYNNDDMEFIANTVLNILRKIHATPLRH